MGKKKILLIAIGILFASTCFCKQISFQIVQHDNSNDEIKEESLVFEDELFDELFDLGYIVTNSEAAISSSLEQDQELWTEGVKEAIEGSSDYFIQINLFYKSTDDFRSNKLYKIEWSLTSVKTGDVLESREMSVTLNSSSINDVIDVSVLLLDDIKKSLLA